MPFYFHFNKKKKAPSSFAQPIDFNKSLQSLDLGFDVWSFMPFLHPSASICQHDSNDCDEIEDIVILYKIYS